jgi:tetratricopeptide (TPR) repeat protein/cell division septation protein DedD
LYLCKEQLTERELMKMHSTATILLFLLSFGSILAQPTLNVTQADSYEKANRLFEQNRFDLALNFYKELTAEEHISPLILFRKAFSYMQCMQFQDAERVFGKLLQEYTDHQQGWFYLGYTYRLQGKYENAANCFDKLAQLNPTIGNYWRDVNFMAIKQPSDGQTFAISKELIRDGSHEIFVSLLNDQLLCATTRMEYPDDINRFTGPDDSKGSNQLCILNSDAGTFSPYLMAGRYSQNVSHVSFSPQSGMIAYSTNAFIQGMRQVSQINKSLDIHFAFLESDGRWNEQIPFEYNDLNHSTGYPYLTENGQTLYFASNMPGGYGGFDLYVSYWTEEGWSLPQNLGPRINTPGDEISPFLEGTHLYFSSDWHPGYGGMDIFKADFDYDTWETPVNLGSDINSSFDDFGFIFIEKFNKGYFISNRKGMRHGENLFEVQKTSKKIVVQIVEYKKKYPITGVLVDLSRCGHNSGITDEAGEYVFNIQEGFDCYVGFQKVGYTTSTVRIKYKDIESHKKTMKIMLNTTGHFYSGKVLLTDNDSTYSIGGVYISAINEVDGELQETYSDEEGKFDLQIKPRGRYFLSFAKSGFRPTYLNIKTENTVNKEVLSDIFLERADNIVIRDIFSTKSGKKNDPGSSNDNAQVENPDENSGENLGTKRTNKQILLNKNQSNGSASSRIINSDVETIPISGYVIQVAAISRKNIDIGPFKTNLGHIGQLYYTQRSDNLIRIMVGVFPNRQEAQEALYKIRNIDKFKESFISELPQGVELLPLENLLQRNKKKNTEVAESATGNTPSIAVKPEKSENTEKPAGKRETDSANRPQSSKEPIAVSGKDQQEFMVQIGRFKNLNWFDNREIEKIGLIEERREGGYILVLLSGYLSLEDAVEAKDKVRQLGYRDAFIVTHGANGTLEKVRN